MIDDRLENRKKRFNSSSQDLVSERCQFSLSLRKEKIIDHFLGKRLKYHTTEEENLKENILSGIIEEDDEYNDLYEINVERLTIPEEIKTEFKEWPSGHFSFAKTYLLNEITDGNILKFVIFLMRNSSQQEGFKELIENETQLFELFLINLFSTNDIEIKCELTWILINITYVSNKFHTKLLAENTLKNLFDLTKDKRVVTNIIWILNNIINNDKVNLKIVLMHLPGYKDYLKQLLLTVSNIDLRIQVLEAFITISELLKNKKKLVQYSDMICAIFNKYICSDHEEVVHKSLCLLSYLTKCEEINMIIIEKSYFNSLFSLFSNDSNYFKRNTFVLRCFGNIAYHNNNTFTPIMIDDKRLFNVIENILAEFIRTTSKKHVDNLMVRECISSLNNLLVDNEQVALYITKETNIYRILLRVSTPSSPTILLYEIMLFFTFLYKSSPQVQKKKILKGEFIDCLIKLLDTENEEIISHSLDTLSYFWNSCENYSEIDTEMRLKFIQHNLKEKLESLMLKNTNKKLSESAEKLHNLLDVEHCTYD